MIQHTVTVEWTTSFNEAKVKEKTDGSVIQMTDRDRVENRATARSHNPFVQ